jgi:hypothetical protein
MLTAGTPVGGGWRTPAGGGHPGDRYSMLQGAYMHMLTLWIWERGDTKHGWPYSSRLRLPCPYLAFAVVRCRYIAPVLPYSIAGSHKPLIRFSQRPPSIIRRIYRACTAHEPLGGCRVLKKIKMWPWRATPKCGWYCAILIGARQRVAVRVRVKSQKLEAKSADGSPLPSPMAGGTPSSASTKTVAYSRSRALRLVLLLLHVALALSALWALLGAFTP